MARENRRFCAPSSGCFASPEAGSTLEGGDPELSIAEQAHYLGHQDALKPSLSVAENLRFWAGFFGAPIGRMSTRRSRRSGSTRSPTCRPPIFRPASGGGCRSRGSSCAKRPIWLLDEPTSTLDAAAQDRLAGLMRAHLAGGGLILAATHGPIGLGDTQELRLDDFVASPPLGEKDKP